MAGVLGGFCRLRGRVVVDRHGGEIVAPAADRQAQVRARVERSLRSGDDRERRRLAAREVPEGPGAALERCKGDPPGAQDSQTRNGAQAGVASGALAVQEAVREWL